MPLIGCAFEGLRARPPGRGVRARCGAALVAALVLIAGCDGGPGDSAGPGGPYAYSCSASFPSPDGGAGAPVLCLDATGGTAQDLANNRQQCAQQGNTFSFDPCPHANAVGGCRQTQGTLVLTDWYYRDGSVPTVSDIQTICAELASLAPPSLHVEFVLP